MNGGMNQQVAVGGGPATIFCCNCQTPMDGTLGMTMCYDCIKLSCDITQGIPREGHVNFCRNCERFLHPPSQWVACQPESRELLALLLKRLKGLNKVRLVDAKFIWTEPHSRRIKIEISVQGEAMPNVIVQQNMGVEYTVIATQCPDCAKSFTVHTWTACVQIRQKVSHKRTFFQLEQLILKYKAHMDTVSIKESRDGVDFFYSQKNHAMKMIEFLSSVAPIRYKSSQEMISQDTHTGSKSYKFTFAVELIPLCRDDLVVLPPKVANSLGSISQIVLCNKVTNNVQFIDFHNLAVADMPTEVYWRNPFPSVSEAARLVDFFVLDVEPVGKVVGKYALADCVVCRGHDMNRSFTVRTHLGGILHPGDSALGYFTEAANFNSPMWDEIPDHRRPDVVLVKKYYPNRTKAKNRVWKLKRMANEHNVEQDTNIDAEKVEQDFEMFLQEIEEDKELQETFNLYKKPTAETVDKDGDQDLMEGDDEEGPTIDVTQLLEEMTLEDEQ